MQEGADRPYENDTPFESHLVDFGNEQSRAEFKALWPIAKMPVLRDTARDQTVPESSIIIEYLTQHYPGTVRLIPENDDLARQTRLWDRVYDFYVHEPMLRTRPSFARIVKEAQPHFAMFPR